MRQFAKISFRLTPEMRTQAEGLMRDRGIMKMSDFVRQAVASEVRSANPTPRFARRRTNKDAA